MICPDCEGKGWLCEVHTFLPLKVTCKDCGGSGILDKKRTEAERDSTPKRGVN